MPKVKIKSKLGRPFWRFGVQLSPDDYVEVDLDAELARRAKAGRPTTIEKLLAELEAQAVPVSEGGAIDMQVVGTPNMAAPRASSSVAAPSTPSAQAPSGRRGRHGDED